MGVEFIFPMRQLYLWLGVALVALAGIAFALRRLERRRGERLDQFAEARLAPRLLRGYDAKVRRPLFWLTLTGFTCLALTFAQPHWGKAWHEVRQQSHDLVICLDTSESMQAANPLPTRLERAKQKIVSLLDEAPGDRFGLIAFAGAAQLQCPLTLDHGYFKAVLNAVDTDTISLKGTDIAAALREATRLFKDESEKTGEYGRDTRAILLISDGEAVSGDAVKEAEQAAEYAHVYVVGVGDPQGTEITLPDTLTWSGARGRAATHVSKLDEDTLKHVAVAGRGGYIRSTPDNSDVDDIYAYIQKLAARTVSSDVRLRLVNRYQWFLAAAIACFMAEGAWLAFLPRVRAWRTRDARQAGGEQEYA